MIDCTVDWNYTNNDGSPLKCGITENNIDFKHLYLKRNCVRIIYDQLRMLNYSCHCCKAIQSIFWPLLQYDAPDRGPFFFWQIIRQSGCANLIDSHASLQSLNGTPLQGLLRWRFYTQLSNVKVCAWTGRCKARCNVTQSKLILIVKLHLTWPWATFCVNSCTSLMQLTTFCRLFLNSNMAGQ